MMTGNRTECEAVVRRLWPHLDGALSDDEREWITRHLEGCVDCRSHFDFGRAFLEAVTAAHDGEDVAPGLREKVLAALAREGFSSQPG
jgi:anti-sigma factor (TIGR02949 family)